MCLKPRHFEQCAEEESQMNKSADWLCNGIQFSMPSVHLDDILNGLEALLLKREENLNQLMCKNILYWVNCVLNHMTVSVFTHKVHIR